MALSRVSVLSRLTAASPSTVGGTRNLFDRSEVPRVEKDERGWKNTKRVAEYGYTYNYYRPGDRLPRSNTETKKVAQKEFVARNAWTEEKARFGQNDYIDLLGDGSIHPAQLLYHVPRWLRGFPGQHKANELVKLIHYRNLYGKSMKRVAPLRYHELQKNIKYLLKRHNYYKADEIQAERNLGLWEEEPDYFHNDKTRRSFQDPSKV